MFAPNKHKLQGARNERGSSNYRDEPEDRDNQNNRGEGDDRETGKYRDEHNRNNNNQRDNRAQGWPAAEYRQRSKFGGFKFGAAFFGWLVANSVSVLLIALLSAIGSAAALGATNTFANNAAAVGIISGILVLLILALAYYAGGYVAGRMSRFDGAKQGFGVWVIGIIITIVLAIAGALLGTSFNLMQQLNLPSVPVSAEGITIGGLLTLLAIIIVSIAAAVFGGKVGARYHRKVDKAAFSNR